MSRHGFDPRGLLALVAVLAAGAASAAPLSTDDTGCGGDAYSSAEVVQGRSRRGPLTAMPDTLCADLAAPPGRTRIEIYGVPGLGGADRGETGPGGYGAGGGYDAGRLGRDGLGGTGESAPYEPRPPRRPRRGD